VVDIVLKGVIFRVGVAVGSLVLGLVFVILLMGAVEVVFALVFSGV